jgi:hypothetical protein
MVGLVALMLALTPADVTAPDELHEVPPAPRWPGVAALIAGGNVLTAMTAYAATTPLCSGCDSSATTQSLFELSAALVGSAWLSLAGMAWLVWVQPEDEPIPRSPGVAAALSGVAQMFIGVARLMTAQAQSLNQDAAMGGVILGTGIAALAAGVAWAIWLNHR